MASSINALTTGSGGVITTADNSGDLNIQSGGSTKIAVTSAGVAVTGLSKGSLPTGSVLQVVQSVFTAGSLIASTSYTATGLAATITPISATSKILVMVEAWHGVTTTGANSAITTLFRGTTAGTNLGDSTYGFGYFAISGVTSFADRGVLTYLDSPATTSATTYTYAARVNSITCSIETSAISVAIPATITLMEIAA